MKESVLITHEPGTLQVQNILDMNDVEAALLFAAMRDEQGKLSLGQAADLSGRSKK